MTDNVPETTTTTVTAAADNAEIVQKFLFAMAEEDFDTVESLAAPDLLWQNVGLPSLRGRARIMNLLRRARAGWVSPSSSTGSPKRAAPC